jgi:ABC-type multidrug transport system permease subunit
MVSITIILLCLPIIFLVALFVGIVKKNKRLWITSLIFLVIITLAECSYFIPVYKTPSATIQKTNSID